MNRLLNAIIWILIRIWESLPFFKVSSSRFLNNLPSRFSLSLSYPGPSIFPMSWRSRLLACRCNVSIALLMLKQLSRKNTKIRTFSVYFIKHYISCHIVRSSVNETMKAAPFQDRSIIIERDTIL